MNALIALILAVSPVVPVDDTVVTVYDRGGVFVYDKTSEDTLQASNDALGKYLDKYFVSGIHDLHQYQLRACVGAKCYKYTVNLTFNHNNDSVDFLKPTRVYTYIEE